MNRPLMLDLFCGAGGCAVGYHRAGFDVVGVDHVNQPRYPFLFSTDDALNVLRHLLEGGRFAADDGSDSFGLCDFTAIHASPPCQRYSTGSRCRKDRGAGHPDLVPETLALLLQSGRPWVVENVPQAPLGYSVMLCGLMFGLKVFRHRLFACSESFLVPGHPSHAGKLIGVDGMCCVVGHGGGTSKRMRMRIPEGGDNKRTWSKAMGIDWMSRDELSQAIPPAYTQFIGAQLLRVLESQRREDCL